MANLVTTQILEDGDRNVVAHVVGFLDTSDLAAVTVLDPATLGTRIPPATRLIIDRVDFTVEDTLTVLLAWDATLDVTAVTCIGRGTVDAKPFGGVTNNAGAGITGALMISTQGWAASAILSFTLDIYCRKAST